jgi:ankyrin repeat protein
VAAQRPREAQEPLLPSQHLRLSDPARTTLTTDHETLLSAHTDGVTTIRNDPHMPMSVQSAAGSARLILVTEQVDRFRRIPIHYAALEGSLEAVQDLLASGVDVDAIDRNGFTPLHFACQESRADVVETLLAAGAAVDPFDSWGNTPLFRAVFNAKGDPSVVRLLVGAGADPDHANASGQSPRGLAGLIANYDTSGYFAPPN